MYVIVSVSQGALHTLYTQWLYSLAGTTSTLTRSLYTDKIRLRALSTTAHMSRAEMQEHDIYIFRLHAIPASLCVP